MGISTDLFTETQIHPDFLCSICHDVLEEATMLEPCEHIYCKKCIEEYHETNTDGVKTCPNCRQPVTGSRKPVRAFSNVLEHLELRCSFNANGCTSVVRLGEFFDHLRKCEFSPEYLKPCAGGCGASLKPAEEPNHNCILHLKELVQVMKLQQDFTREELDGTKQDLQTANLELERMKAKTCTTCKAHPKVFFDITADGEPLGRIIMELRADVVPKTAENFRALCTGEYGIGYKGSVFRYIVPDFRCQAGKSLEGMSIYGRIFPHENFQLTHNGPGILSMGNSLSGGNTGSEFFITCVRARGLDGKHVVFGAVIDGMDVVKKMEGLGSKYGHTSKKIVIADCGQL